jgi:hypothetical protein
MGTNETQASAIDSRFEAAPEQQWWGQFLFGGSAQQIAVGQDADGHLEVFYVGTNNYLYHRWQMSPNSLVWSDETRFPSDSATQVAVGRNKDGRLEIFYVGTNNDLYHNWQVAPNGTWAGESRLSNASANQVAVGSNADGHLEVFYVGTNGKLYHNWQVTPGSSTWAGETQFPGDSAQQVVVGGNTSGELEIFYVGTNNYLYHNWQVAPNGPWAGENRLSNASAKSIAWGRNSDGRQEVFYVGTNNNLYHNWQVVAGGGWNGEVAFAGDSAQQIAVAQNADGRLEIFYVGTNYNLYHNYQVTAGSSTWQGEAQMKDDAEASYVVAANDANGRLEVFYVGVNGNNLYHTWQVVPTPGFGSTENYFFNANCQPLIGVTVTINVTQDIVCQAVAGGPQMGFGFQLNCYSPKNELSALQQYCLMLWGNTIEGGVDNWPLTGDNVINSFWSMGSLPGKVPAGYKLVIALENDQNLNITGAIFTVIDNTGKTVTSVNKQLSSIGGTPAKIAPIIAFQLNLVGPTNAEAAVLSSGAGTFVYSSRNIMTALTSEPSCAESGYMTAETANSLYDAVSTTMSSLTFSQGFHVSLTEAPARKRMGKVRPHTIYRGPVV